jgi:hypothetical protein
MKILKSRIHDEAEFRGALEKLRLAKVDHLMSGVIGVPPPGDPVLDPFIKRTPTGPDTPDEFTIDVEIINDDPPPPSPEELKARAINESRAQEQAEIAALLPANKVRLMQIEVNRAFQTPEDERSVAQRVIISDWQEFQKKIEEIQYDAAVREAEL